MTNEREWTITQRAYRLGKLMGRGKWYTTEQVRQMLGYRYDSSVYSFFGALVDEDIRHANGHWMLCGESQNSLAKHGVSE